MNSIVIFVIDTNRVITWAEIAYGVIVPESYDIYDPLIHDYRIGMLNYEEEDFDESTELLTDEACAKYGISTAHKSKVYKDTYIEPGDIRYVWEEATKALKEEEPAIADQNKRLVVTFEDVAPGSPVIQIGGGPNGIDMIPTNYYWYSMWSPEQRSFTVSACYVVVTKQFVDGTTDTSATDVITLTANKGNLLTFTGTLSAGVTSFMFLPGVDGGYLSCEATSDQPDTLPGNGSLWIQAYELNENYKKRTYVSKRDFFIPGTVTTTSGKDSDGRVYQFTIPTATPHPGYDYDDIQVTSVELHASANISADDFKCQFEVNGTPSTNTGEIVIPVGSNYVIDISAYDGFTMGDVINLLVTAGSASDLNVHIEFE